MGYSIYPATSAAIKQKKIASFTSSGTWTVPSGVTYAIAHVLGAGGGSGFGSAGIGGSSTVAFSNPASASGGAPVNLNSNFNDRGHSVAGTANSGQGAGYGARDSGAQTGTSGQAANGAFIVQGETVTPAGSITITVGAGGTAGTGGSAGGSGYIYIEYYE
jgi:hypothetical protein